MTRGPDYAHRLSRPERETLDLLLSHVNGPTVHKRQWWRPALAAAAAAVVVGGAGVAVQVLAVDPVPESVVAATPPVTAAEALERLARVQQPAKTPAPKALPVREALFFAVRGQPHSCSIIGVAATSVGDPVSTGRAKTYVQTAEVPPGAAAVAGCVPTPKPGPTMSPQSNPESWANWQNRLAQQGMWLGDPPGLAVRADRALLAVPPVAGAEGRWWPILLAELTGPFTTPEYRESALLVAARAARDDPRVTLLPERTEDLSGRAVVGFRVPYRETWLDVLFLRDTGEVSQWEYREEPFRVDITVIQRAGLAEARTVDYPETARGPG